MRQAMGALTGSAKKDEPKDEKKSDDKDKKQNEMETVHPASKLKLLVCFFVEYL